MQVAVVITAGAKQIMLAPENDHERQALALISPTDNIRAEWKPGTFHDALDRTADLWPAPCQGGYLRLFGRKGTVMLTITPATAGTTEESK